MMGVVDSNMVIEHDSRRKPFGLWDGSHPPPSTEPVALGSQRSRVKPRPECSSRSNARVTTVPGRRRLSGSEAPGELMPPRTS